MEQHFSCGQKSYPVLCRLCTCTHNAFELLLIQWLFEGPPNTTTMQRISNVLVKPALASCSEVQSCVQLWVQGGGGLCPIIAMSIVFCAGGVVCATLIHRIAQTTSLKQLRSKGFPIQTGITRRFGTSELTTCGFPGFLGGVKHWRMGTTRAWFDSGLSGPLKASSLGADAG